VFQANVSCGQSVGFRLGCGSHVLRFTRIRPDREPQVEVRERGVGPRRQGRSAPAEPYLYPSRVPKLRGTLDEGASVFRQSQTY